MYRDWEDGDEWSKIASAVEAVDWSVGDGIKFSHSSFAASFIHSFAMVARMRMRKCLQMHFTIHSFASVRRSILLVKYMELFIGRRWDLR